MKSLREIRNLIGLVTVATSLVVSGCNESAPSAAAESSGNEATTIGDDNIYTSVEATAKASETNGEKQAQPTDPPAAKKSSRSSNEIVDITFDDLKFDIEKGGDFEPSMLTDKIKDLDGRRVRIRGFMLSSFQNHGLKNFVLLQNVNCPFGGPEAYVYHNIIVDLLNDQTVSYSLKPITVEGTLSIRPFPPGGEEKEVSIFHLSGEKAY